MNWILSFSDTNGICRTMLDSLHRCQSRQLLVPNLMQPSPSLLCIVSHSLLAWSADSTCRSVVVTAAEMMIEFCEMICNRQVTL
jgi:hypothetical protein